MDALQAMTGSGGWPLNIFLLPNGKPFYGGTYFPPIAMQNRASWMDVLKGVHEAFENNYEKLETQANNLTGHLLQSNIKITSEASSSDNALPTKEETDIIATRILQNADITWGGFGNAPKFPQTFALQMLLRHFHITQNKASLYQVVLSLDKMIQGGIYDHIGGGFSRYSTDTMWQAPHFEKMLYDNALLLNVLSEAYQITGHAHYKVVIQQTILFLEQELSNKQGVFYAALDADSEGVEGKFYTWTYAALKEIIPVNEFEYFCNYYQIKQEGNWEHTNILWTQQSFMDSETPAFKSIKNILFEKRSKKIRPALDHKIILSWNCLMVVALCKTAAALSDKALVDKAVQAMQWIEKNMFNEKDNYFYHVNTNGKNSTCAFLDDYATLIQSYIFLQEMTGDTSYLYKAKKWTNYVLENFIDEEIVFFYFTPAYQKDIIVRKKENYDGAQPSGNALMSYNLYYLGIMFDQPNWCKQSQKMVGAMHKMILQYPSSFSIWAQTLTLHALGFTELVSIGSKAKNAIFEAQAPFLPLKMLLFTPTEDPNLILSVGKNSIDNQYFVCKNGTCSAPFLNINDYLTSINQVNY
jgi:uncharacterized protein YyaL (SSP411 family)